VRFLADAEKDHPATLTTGTALCGRLPSFNILI
jgi:hypothetical protein